MVTGGAKRMLGEKGYEFDMATPGSIDRSSGCVKSETPCWVSDFFMRIDQALDFIHACPPGKFESLSDLLSPELVQACWPRRAPSPLRRRRMPMERVLWAIIGMSLFRHVPMAQLANQLDILLPGDRPFVVPSAFIQARQNWLTKPFDRCSSRPPHSGISSVSTHLGRLAAAGRWTGWSGARPIPLDNAGAFAKSKTVQGRRNIPRSACCVRWS